MLGIVYSDFKLDYAHSHSAVEASVEPIQCEQLQLLTVIDRNISSGEESIDDTL